MIAKCTADPRTLLVFSDDWGRHPSSCQHLIRQLLPEYKVVWVNTIGTRAPRLDWNTVRRVGEKLRQWSQGNQNAEPTLQKNQHKNLTVVNPRMWPWFSKSHDRRLNSWLLSRQLNTILRDVSQPITAVTTLPITADLPGLLPVQKWVYYCVDDFGEWPGLDGDTLRSMDIQMISQADDLIAVSAHLQQMIQQQGKPSTLLTHGVDLSHWTPDAKKQPDSSPDFPFDLPSGKLAVFWGVVDRRLNLEMIRQLSQQLTDGHILLAGPQQDPHPEISGLQNVICPGPLPFDRLPELAAAADVLIMPYADLPVTRAMQPLKMKEYLATGQPVVVSCLPAVTSWSDCMDVCESPRRFTEAVVHRIRNGLSAEQLAARHRLHDESWASKARVLRQHLSDDRGEKGQKAGGAETARTITVLADNHGSETMAQH